MVWNEMSDVAFDQILIRSVLSTRTISIFAVPICRGVNGYLKLSGQVVMPRAATARRQLLFCQKLDGQLPTMPTRHWRSCYLQLVNANKEDRTYLGTWKEIDVRRTTGWYNFWESIPIFKNLHYILHDVNSLLRTRSWFMKTRV